MLASRFTSLAFTRLSSSKGLLRCFSKPAQPAAAKAQPAPPKAESKPNPQFVSPDIGTTEYEVIPSKFHDMDAVPSWMFKFNDGKYHILKGLSDESYLLMQGVRYKQGIVLPRFAGSAYYSLEKDGKIYHVFNADRLTYGRICNMAAKFLVGKHKPGYDNASPEQGDICIILNAENLHLFGRRMVDKELIYHSGYVGNLKRIPFKEMVFKKPEILFRQSIFKMMPKNKQRFDRLKKLYIYRDQDHPFSFLPKFGHVKQADPSVYAPELFIPEQELVFSVESKEQLEQQWNFLKDKKYVIEPSDPEKAKRFKVSPKDINEAGHEYKQWLKAVRRSTDWRPVKKVQKTDIFNNEPGIAMVGSPSTVEKYNLDWVHQDAQGTSSSEEGDDIPYKADMSPAHTGIRSGGVYVLDMKAKKGKK